MKHNWIIIDGKRYNLASLKNLDISDSRCDTGIKLEAVYLMPRKKEVIIHTYSIWENRQTYGVQGDRYHIADEWEIAQLAERFGNSELLELVPEGEI